MNTGREVRIGWIILLPVLGLLASPEDPESLFEAPPEAARPGVRWHWMGCNVTREGITRDLEALEAAGFSSATIFGMADVCTPWAASIPNSPSEGLLAFTDSWWELVRHAAAEGQRLGLDIGVHNCPGYESSGGPWIPPDLSMLEVVYSDWMVIGPTNVPLDLPPPKPDLRSTMPFPVVNLGNRRVEKPDVPERQTFFRDIAMLAVPAEGEVEEGRTTDLTGLSQWSVPAGKWVIYRFGYTTQGKLTQPNQWEVRGLECDKLNPRAVEFHMSHLLGDLNRHLGDLVGTGLRHILFDSYEAGDPSWTPRMREQFAARRGYDLTPFLPCFAGRIVGSAEETARFKSDFKRTIEELHRDVYFPTIRRMLHTAGLDFVCEPYGGPWRVGEVAPHVDRVMTEFWTRAPASIPSIPDGILNAANGGVHNILEAEAFTGTPEASQWTECPAGLKALGDGAFLAGINRLVLHHSVHQPWEAHRRPGITMGRWGTHFGRNQTWWEPGKAWVRYLSRCQALLQWGAPAPGDFVVGDGLQVKSIHRRYKDTDVFFVANLSFHCGTARCLFNLAGRRPELWDPVTGVRRDLTSFVSAFGTTSVDLEFAPAQSVFVVFRDSTQGPDPVGRPNWPVRVTEMELPGPWQVGFDPRWGGPENVTFDRLDDWIERPEPGIRYYSGTAVYRTRFDIRPASIPRQLDLGAVQHLARVTLNGHDLGVVWCAPWSVRIPAKLLKANGNGLEIQVVNVWANRLIGDEQEPPDCDWQPASMPGGSYLERFPDWFVLDQPRPSPGRFCFTTWNYFSKDSPLVSSGLLGPVRLMAEDWTASKAAPPAAHSRAGRAPD